MLDDWDPFPKGFAIYQNVQEPTKLRRCKEAPLGKVAANDDERVCDICKKEISDPRLMPCLHSFCLGCLRRLESEVTQKSNFVKSPRNHNFKDNIKMRLSDLVVCKGKATDLSGISNSGYKDDPHQKSKLSEKDRTMKCPTCGFNNPIPEGGVNELPHNYLLQHKILVAKLNNTNIKLLCDVCLLESVATSRCTKCLFNLCSQCSIAHGKEEISLDDHVLVSLDRNVQSGSGITEIRRQPMCPAHPQNDARFFCLSCNRMTCRHCTLTRHRDHSWGVISKTARMYRRKIKEAIDETASATKEAEVSKTRSVSVLQDILSNCTSVRKDIDAYINSYIEALEEHRKGLKIQVERARCTELQALRQHLLEVEARERDRTSALKFGENLLTEGSDFEIISLASPLLRRLEWIIQVGTVTSKLKSKSGNLLQFLKDERAGTIKNHPVFGVLTSQIVSAINSSITTEGLNLLKTCKQKQQCQIELVTRDARNKLVHHGAETIDVDLRYSQCNGLRQVPVFAHDRQDGTYIIIFTPDAPGSMRLSISIRGHAIKGSPFTVNVDKPQIHRGIYHCCSFCSSGGSKKAFCGCGARKPGGYFGCSHGQAGHPGKRHWSCCGNIYPNSECLRKSSGVYHLTF